MNKNSKLLIGLWIVFSILTVVSLPFVANNNLLLQKILSFCGF